MRRARAIAIATVLGQLCFHAPAQSLPRYHLDAGDRLVYERRGEVRVGGEVTQRFVEQVQIFCIGRQGEETLVLLECARVRSGKLDPPRGWLLHVDRRGATRYAPEMQTRIDDSPPLLDVLPTMPATLESEAGWASPADPLGRYWRCSAAPSAVSDGGPRGYDYAVEDAAATAALGVTQRGRFWFDPREGLVTRAESEFGDERSRTRTITTFFKKLPDPPEWRRKRLAESERYIRALRLEDVVLDELLSKPDRSQQPGSRIERVWNECLDSGPRDEDSPFRSLARARLARLPEDLPLFRERADLAAQWLSRPAAHWSLQDLSGATIRSEDVRDRTTVECFWSAASPASLRTFEVLRALRDAFDEKTLRIVCLNIDDDVVRARRAAESFGTGLMHVLSGPPIRGDAPAELPVIRVLDRDSRIQRIVIGWRPSLVDVVKPHVR